ncbi:unnamed protein product [Rotaria sordida]|uniref:Uncharacterized protein n=1 Tax=Rotaria sordida TaxID=392033 RepID=A0A815PC71_9BILA|nr:unnamed protein product [Rotaria sordida]CAF3878510.1 unnamed protein product [Rotaria sordida]
MAATAGNSDVFDVEQLVDNIFQNMDIDINILNDIVADFHNDFNYFNINLNEVIDEYHHTMASVADTISAAQQQQQQPNTQVPFRLLIPRCAAFRLMISRCRIN